MFVRPRPASSLLLISVLIAAVSRASGFYMMVSHEFVENAADPQPLSAGFMLLMTCMCWVSFCE